MYWLKKSPRDDFAGAEDCGVLPNNIDPIGGAG